MRVLGCDASSMVDVNNSIGQDSKEIFYII